MCDPGVTPVLLSIILSVYGQFSHSSFSNKILNCKQPVLKRINTLLFVMIISEVPIGKNLRTLILVAVLFPCSVDGFTRRLLEASYTLDWGGLILEFKLFKSHSKRYLEIFAILELGCFLSEVGEAGVFAVQFYFGPVQNNDNCSTKPPKAEELREGFCIVTPGPMLVW